MKGYQEVTLKSRNFNNAILNLRSGGDTPAAQYSGGDEETEAEDQVDHAGPYSNGFTSYSNFRLGLPRGDFYFGDNELDIELDGLNSSN